MDFYPVFSELEKALTNELDFLAEAQAIEKVHTTHRPNCSA